MGMNISIPPLPPNFRWLTAGTYPAILGNDPNDPLEWHWVWVYMPGEGPHGNTVPLLTSHQRDGREVHYDTDVESLSEQELIDTLYAIFTFMEKK